VAGSHASTCTLMALLVNVSKTNWAVQFVLSDAYIFINLFIIFCINYVTQTNNK